MMQTEMSVQRAVALARKVSHFRIEVRKSQGVSNLKVEFLAQDVATFQRIRDGFAAELAKAGHELIERKEWINPSTDYYRNVYYIVKAEQGEEI
jgi:hypothetical protein